MDILDFFDSKAIREANKDTYIPPIERVIFSYFSDNQTFETKLRYWKELFEEFSEEAFEERSFKDDTYYSRRGVNIKGEALPKDRILPASNKMMFKTLIDHIESIYLDLQVVNPNKLYKFNITECYEDLSPSYYDGMFRSYTSGVEEMKAYVDSDSRYYYITVDCYSIASEDESMHLDGRLTLNRNFEIMDINSFLEPDDVDPEKKELDITAYCSKINIPFKMGDLVKRFDKMNGETIYGIIEDDLSYLMDEENRCYINSIHDQEILPYEFTACRNKYNNKIEHFRINDPGCWYMCFDSCTRDELPPEYNALKACYDATHNGKYPRIASILMAFAGNISIESKTSGVLSYIPEK